MYDVLIVGGGPAGSTCARTLSRAGARVAVVDRAEFPRVKLCAGWLSPSFWDVIERAPREYPRGLWEWRTCHVHYRGKQYSLRGHGWFIRRYELDEWLLRESGAELHLGTNVKDIVREPDGTWRVGELRAKYLVGAGGTHCPVARLLAPERPRRAVGVQELELQTDEQAVARTRIGNDGEPELVLFDGLGGYGWNVPKRDWLNIGCGTLDATAVRDAWQVTHALLSGAGHVPAEAEAQLRHMKGHSYFLFDPAHLDRAAQDNAFLVGDSLGLAHPLVDDYRRTYRLVEAGRRLARKPSGARDGKASSAADRFVARGFAWMFSGARLPAPKLVDFVLDHAPQRFRVAARPGEAGARDHVSKEERRVS